jgi:hypothetical protein
VDILIPVPILVNLKAVVEVTTVTVVEVVTMQAVATTIAILNHLPSTSIPGSHILHIRLCLTAALISLSIILRKALILLSSLTGVLMLVTEHSTIPNPITHLFLFLPPITILTMRLSRILPNSTLHSPLMRRHNNTQHPIQLNSNQTRRSGMARLIHSRLIILMEGREAGITKPMRLSRMREGVLLVMATVMIQCTQLLVPATASHICTILA